ncbi:MAG: hypothetical protein M3Y55_02095 [Pseudomonadota bacterium]|nr:hypothetical protein [Pseudomonadota bacterium]MDQ2762382.1 hypothetical protein [Pseudomonadota bacterium]
MASDPRPFPLTPAQAAHYRKLRNVIFTTAVTVFGFLIWQAMGTGELEQPHLTGASRATALTLSTVFGLGLAWLMSCGVAMILVRAGKP